jgi:molybdenum cofactor guanylyltransferase
MLMDNVTGIILSGGKSSRMGMDKGLAGLNGKALVTYSIDILSSITAKIFISSNNPSYEKFGLPVIRDIYPEIGPMGGICSCLLNTSTDFNLVLSSDMPFMKPELYLHLLACDGDSQVILPSFDGIHPEPMCGIYHRSILPDMRKFIMKGNYKLPDLFKTIRFKMIHITPEMDLFSEDMMININTLHDLAKAEKQLNK